jgi:hypothetical protein
LLAFIKLSCAVFQKAYEVYFRKNIKSVHKKKMRYSKSDFVGKLHTVSLWVDGRGVKQEEELNPGKSSGEIWGNDEDQEV